MKNLVCPISNEKVAEHLPRVTAFINISLIAIFVYTNYAPIIAFLSIDFLSRGFGYGKYSLINYASIAISKLLRLKSKPIDKAPKLFAARLGGVMFAIAFLLSITDFNIAAVAVLGLVAGLSALEGFFSFCVGCVIYTFLILPVFKTSL
jgi:hypothetical protein